MTRQITKTLVANESEHTVRVVAPKGNVPITINAVPGSKLNLDFDPAEADYSRQGTDLVFAFPDGNTMTLDGFFAVSSEPLPSFILPDGTLATAADLFTDIDISPAAGPSARGQEGSGAGEYNDNAGELIGGISRLGNTDSIYWERGTDTPEVLQQSAALLNDGSGFAISPTTPPVGPGVTPPPPSMYNARAVLYKTDAAASDSVRFRLLDGNNDSVDPSDPSVSYSLADDNGYFDLSTLVLNADGTLSLSLSSAGLAALAAAGNANIYEYLTITVNGKEYRMQIVVNQSGDFDSAVENTDSNNGNFSGHEWHSETAGTGKGDRYGDQGDNEAWFEKSLGNDGAFKGSFTGYAGNDTINIENAHSSGYGMSGGATLDTGAGRDSVNIKGGYYGMLAGQASEHNSINDAETVNIEDGIAAMYALNNGSNSITNAENVTLTGKNGEMYAWHDGANTISDVQGDVTLSGGDTSMDALYSGVNTITDVQGNVTLTAVKKNTINAGRDGANTISDVQGDVTLTGQWGNMDAWLDGTNTISDVQGNVTLSAKHDCMGATYGGANILSDVQGDVTLSGEGYNMYAWHGGGNTISDVQGAVTISGGVYNMYAMYSGVNTIRGVQRVEISASTDYYKPYALYATDGGRNIIDNSASEKALTLIIKMAKIHDIALYTTATTDAYGVLHPDGANIIKGSGLNDVIDITGRIQGSNSIETHAGNDLVKLNGKIEGLVLDMGDGYDTLMLTANTLADFNSNYLAWLTSLLSAGGHGIESIQVGGFANLSHIPGWLDTACKDAGVDISLHGGEVDAALAQSHTYLADHSYTINVDGSEADGQHVTLNSGHDRLECTGNVGHTANTFFDTGEGNDYAQTHDASLGSLFALDMGGGNDMLALSGDVSIASGASISGGDGYDTLVIGNLDSLNGTDVSGSGLNLSQLDGILNGFEALDMTGGDGTSLKIDVNGLGWLGIDSGSDLLFTGDGTFDVTLLGSDNVLLVKGDSTDHVDFSGSGWSATGSTVTTGNIAYDVYGNSLNEYVLVQQIISVAS